MRGIVALHKLTNEGRIAELMWADEQRVRGGTLRLIKLADDDEELEYIGIVMTEGDGDGWHVVPFDKATI